MGVYSKYWTDRAQGGKLMIRLDARTRPGRILERVRQQLTEHVGGHPTAAQQLIIDRCAWISVRLDLLDSKLAKGEDFNLPDTNYYLAWSNALSRMLMKLGIKQSAVTVNRPSLDEINTEVGL
jgi:hypothetical protein